MSFRKWFVFAAAFGFLGMASAANDLGSAPIKIGKIDGVVTDLKGMTLYTFDKDASGKSTCNGSCAENWPPLMAGSNEVMGVNFSVVTRDDGRKQWAYKGKPLYTYSKDQKPGDKTGNNFNGVWHIVRFPIDR